MKNVLCIDYFFPPLEADWRAIAFSKYLPPLGWNPIFLSADPSVQYGKDYSTLNEISPGTTVYRIGHREKRPELKYLLQKLRLSADYPDVFKNWLRPAVGLAREIVRQSRIDLLYSASPAYTASFVAMRVKQKTGLPWVADFLDGWAVNEILLEGIKGALAPPLNRWLIRRTIRGEKQILERADRVVSIHPCVKRQWIELHGIDGGKIDVITDGYDEANFSGLRPRHLSEGRIVITFLGSVYSATVPIIRTFLEQVRDIGPQVGTDIEVVFIGRGVEKVKNLGCQNTTCILNIPRKKCFEYALGGDFLFMALPPYSRFTLTKTYDYLRLGKPILALIPDESDGAYIVKNARAGFILPYDATGMKSRLLEIFSEYQRGPLNRFDPDRQYIARFERGEIARRIVAVFDAVVKPAQ